jgi:hypothetical protein
MTGTGENKYLKEVTLVIFLWSYRLKYVVLLNLFLYKNCLSRIN